MVEFIKLKIAIISSLYDIPIDDCSYFIDLMKDIVNEMNKYEISSMNDFCTIINSVGSVKNRIVTDCIGDIRKVLKQWLFEELIESEGMSIQCDEISDVNGQTMSVVHVNALKTNQDKPKMKSHFVGSFPNKGNEIDVYSLLNNISNSLKVNENINLLSKCVSFTSV